MTTTKRKCRSCWDIRLARAKQARTAARKRNVASGLVWLLFMMALLSIPVTGFSVTPTPSGSKQKPVVAPPVASDDGGPHRSASPYELGAPGMLRPRPHRYGGHRPSLSRLLKDLRRPAASRAAADMLMARIPAGDDELREWVQEQLDDGSVTALALWARPGLAETDIFDHWKEVARRQAAEEATALRASLTATGGVAGSYGGNVSEGGSDGNWKR